MICTDTGGCIFTLVDKPGLLYIDGLEQNCGILIVITLKTLQSFIMPIKL